MSGRNTDVALIASVTEELLRDQAVLSLLSSGVIPKNPPKETSSFHFMSSHITYS